MPLKPTDAIDAWILEIAPRALAYARSLVRQQADAEDLVHDCFGRLLARAGEYDLPRDGSKLLFKSITHAAINASARKSAKTGQTAMEAEDGAERPDQRAMRGELEEAVHRALGELDVTDRALVELRSLGHSLVEAADMLEISHANARVKLHRARQTLAERLRPFLEEKS